MNTEGQSFGVSYRNDTARREFHFVRDSQQKRSENQYRDGTLAYEPESTFTDQWWGSPKSGYSTPTPGACLVERRRDLDLFQGGTVGLLLPIA